MSLDSILAQELAKLKAGQGRTVRSANPLGKALAPPTDKQMLGAEDIATAKQSGKLKAEAYNPTSKASKRATQKGTIEYAMQVFDRLSPGVDSDTRHAALSYVWARSGGDPDKVNPTLATTAAKLARGNPEELFRVSDAYRTQRAQREFEAGVGPAPRQISGPSVADIPNEQASAQYAASNPREYAGHDSRAPIEAAISNSIKYGAQKVLGEDVGGAIAPMIDPISQADFLARQVPQMAQLATTPEGRSQLLKMAKETMLSWADPNAPTETRISSGINLALMLVGAPHLINKVAGAAEALRGASKELIKYPETSALGKQAQALLKGGAGYTKAPLGFDIQGSIDAALKSGDAATVSLARNVATKEVAKNYGLSEKSAKDMVDITIRDTMKRMGMNDRTIIADAGVVPDTPSEITAKAEAEKAAKQVAQEAKRTVARPKAAVKPKKTSTEPTVVETPKQEVKAVGQEKQAKANGQRRQKGLLSSNDSSTPAVETVARKTAAGTTSEAPAMGVGSDVTHPEYGEATIVRKQPNGMWEIALDGDKNNTAIVPQKELAVKGKAENRAPSQAPEPVDEGAKVSPDSGEIKSAGQPSPKKEPWQMTRDEYSRWYHDPERRIADLEVELQKANTNREYKYKDRPALIQDAIDRIKAGKSERLSDVELDNQRRGDISDALSEGKPVPPEVLKDYPDLAAKYEKTKEVGNTPNDRVQSLNARITAERKISAELRARAKQNKKFAADYRANGGKGMSGVEPFTVLEAKARLNDLHVSRLVAERDKLVSESAPRGIDAELARQKKAALTPTPKELKFDYSSRNTIVNGQVAYPATNLDARTVNALGGESVALIPGEVQELHLLDAKGDSIRVIAKSRNGSADGLSEIKRQLKEVKPNGQEVKAEAPPDAGAVNSGAKQEPVLTKAPVPPKEAIPKLRAPKSMEEAKALYGHNSDEYLNYLREARKKAAGKPPPGSKQRGAVTKVSHEEVKIAYEIGAFHVRRGVKTVKEFISKMVEDVGDWVKPHAARMFKEISAGDDIEKVSRKTFNALAHRIENPTHADTAALRDELGYDAYDAKPETVKQWKAEASKLSGRELQIAQDAIDNKERALKPGEEIAIGRRLNKFVEEMDKAQASGDHNAWQFAHDSAETLMDALDQKGSEAARAMRARQEFVKASRTPWAQTQRARAAKGGELTTRERIPIENGAKAEADLATRLEKAEGELKKMRAERSLEVPDRTRAARRGDLQTRRAAAAKTIKTELQRLLAGPAGMILGVGGGGAGADLSALRRAFMEYAKTLVEEAPMALGDVVSRITKDFKLEKTQFDADFLIDSIANEGNRMSMSEAAKNRAKLTMEARQAAEDIATNATMRTKLGKAHDKVTKRIAVLEEKINAGGSAPTKKVPEVVPDALKELVAKRDELQKKLDALNTAKRPPKGGVTENGLREAINRLTSRIESGDYSRKAKGKPQVPPELIDLYDQKKFLEKELNRRRLEATKAERRVASLKKSIAEYEQAFKDGGFKPPNSREKAKSKEITNLEIKLGRLKKENDLRIANLKPTHWTERVETIFSGLQLSNPMARAKDLAGNTNKLVQEAAAMSHVRYGYQAAMRKLVADPDFRPGGGNPLGKGQLDLFDESYWGHVKEESKGAFQGIDVDAQKKFGSGTVFHGAAGATDVPFRGLYLRAYLRDWAYGNAQLALPGVSPKDPQFIEMVRESIRNAPETVVRDAHDWSAHMTYNAENVASAMRAAISEGIERIKRSEKEKGRTLAEPALDMLKVVNNASMRFGKVIYNVGVNKVRMSPAGLIEGGLKLGLAAIKAKKGVKMTTYEAKMLSDILARGTVGTAGFALGYYLKKSGVNLPWAGREMVGIKTTPDGQIDYKNDGTPARTSTTYIDQGAVGEISSNVDAAMLLGWATAYYTEDHTVKKQSKNVLDMAGAYSKAVMEQMINQPMFGQADLLADVDQNGAASAAANFLVNKFANLGIISETARRADAIKEYGFERGMVYDRPVKIEKKEALGRLKGAVQSKMPVKRSELPTSAIPERW